MRVNIYLNENNQNDKKIVEFLQTKYNSSAYIKEILFGLANGSSIEVLTPGMNTINKKAKDIEFEEIIGLDDVDL